MFEKRAKHHLFPVLMTLYIMPVLAGSAPTTAVVAGTWQARDTAFARVSAHQQAILRLPFPARIVALDVEPGARVSTGQVLARFDAPLLRQHLAAWQQARLEVRLAQKRLQVLRESEQQHAITRRELLAGGQAVAQAEGKSRMAWGILAADLDLLRVDARAVVLEQRIGKEGQQAVARSLGRLQAPFNGVVAARLAALGEQLAGGDPVLELEDLEQVYLDAGVPETALRFWAAGETHWRMRTHGGSLRPLGGSPLYDASSGLWQMRFEVDNPDLRLRDGAWVKVEHRGAPQPVFWVPAAAVVSRNGRAWVVVAQGDTFKPVEVRVGPAEDGRIPVLSGLQAGTRVLIEGAYEVLYRDLKKLIKFVD